MSLKYRIEITEDATQSILEIYDHIALESPVMALSFTKRLMGQIESLDQFPLRCPEILENKILGTKYRHMIYGAYRTIFQIKGDVVHIQYVIHGAKLLDPTLLDQASL